MKKLIALSALALVAALFVGYYETRWAEDNKTVFFIKQHPTFQLEFVNLFASDADDKPLAALTPQERQEVMDYCKYRLGIVTRLETQAELEACKER
ncbi:hypothetical protein IFR09_17795 [Pseudomonas syringae]|nr:hypothetical protein [Pseudomonas syringae]MBD8576405.1 hypothetical protein [Pseudomonas syringae]MBD8791592.1 hypothetical protein [Pseudomonas syringae]MBD8802490.1 hypothetical protein [Pseudomonas syringae]MBD8813016.1 hypothetical protein [Pseudomonas syringae]